MTRRETYDQLAVKENLHRQKCPRCARAETTTAMCRTGRIIYHQVRRAFIRVLELRPCLK